MIASILCLSRSDCEKLKIIDEYSIHKAVYSLFPKQENGTRNFLFADKGGDFFKRRILILSKEKPQNPEYGSVESKEIALNFLQHEYYGFEVLVNPVKRDNKTGKIIPIRGRANLMEWFTARAPGYGFSVLDESLTVQDTDVVQFDRTKNTEKNNIVLGKARFIGKLKVTDRELFIKTFETGLGKGKAFGFGLLQIVPITLTNN